MRQMRRSNGHAPASLCRPAGLLALCCGLGAVLSGLAAPLPALAQSADVNAILGGEAPAQSAPGDPSGIRPRAFPGASPSPSPSPPNAGGNDQAAPQAAAPRGNDERWVTSDHPAENLAVISVHPLPGESCQDVLFDIRPSTRVRHDVSAGASLDFDLGELCLLGIRNESDRRTLVVRVGEELKTVAIVSDSRLNSGIALGPGREIMTPIRPLDITALTIGVEAVWDDQIDAANPVIESFGLRLAKRTPGS